MTGKRWKADFRGTGWQLPMWLIVMLMGFMIHWTPAWGQLPPPEEGPTVLDVRIIGARRYPEAAVLNELKTRKGRPYSQRFVLEDTKRLDSTQRYVMGVTVETHQEKDGVIVEFRVVERATIKEVRYEGFKHLSRDEVEQATGLRKGFPMSVAANRRAVTSLERMYQSKGYLFARVSLVEGDKDEDMNVVFRVTEGPVVRVRGIEFQGNKFVTGARLKTQIESESRILGLFGGQYNPAMLEHDVIKLTEYYRSFGFFDVRIRREVKWNPGYETVDVVFVIDEGQRFLVRDVRVEGNKKLDNDMLLAYNQVKTGTFYKQQEVQSSSKTMQDLYGSKGEINTFVRPVVNFEENSPEVSLVYQVNETPGQPASVGEIKIIGNSVTRENVIRRQLLFFPGQLLSVPAMRASEANLRRLGIFKVEPENGIAPTVTVLDPDGPSPFKDVLVEVQEDRTGQVNFGFGINSDAGLTGSVVLNERNFDITRIPTSIDDFLSNRAFRGAGQEFRAEAVPGTIFNRYSVSWREPYLFDSSYSLGTSAYYTTRRFNEYDERRYGGRISVGHRFTPVWSANASIRLENVEVRNVPYYAPEDYLSVLGNNQVYAPKMSIIRDSRDSWLRPTEGNNFEVGFEYAFGSYDYPIFTIEDNQYFTLYERPDGSGRHVLALRGMLGIAGSHTPVYDRFFAGGNHTIRGFDFRGVGPDINGFKVGGQFMALGSVEYQIPLMANDKVFAVVFSDFGTVESKVEIKDVRVSVGAGLRLVVPMFGPLPIALDWAFPLNKTDYDDRRTFQFFVGFTR